VANKITNGNTLNTKLGIFIDEQRAISVESLGKEATHPGPSPGVASGARYPHLKSVTPRYVFGPPVAAYIQYCISMVPPLCGFCPLMQIPGDF